MLYSASVFMKVGQTSHCYLVSLSAIFGSYFRLTQHSKRLPESLKIYVLNSP